MSLCLLLLLYCKSFNPGGGKHIQGSDELFLWGLCHLHIKCRGRAGRKGDILGICVYKRRSVIIGEEEEEASLSVAAFRNRVKFRPGTWTKLGQGPWWHRSESEWTTALILIRTLNESYTTMSDQCENPCPSVRMWWVGPGYWQRQDRYYILLLFLHRLMYWPSVNPLYIVLPVLRKPHICYPEKTSSRLHCPIKQVMFFSRFQ